MSSSSASLRSSSAPPRIAPTHVSDASRPRRHRVLRAATAVAGAALVVFVAYDGSVGWRAAGGALVVLATASLLAWIGRSDDRAAGRIAGALGVAAIVLGVAFLPHVAKRGAPAVATAAVASSLAGVVLLGAGVALASRGHRPVRRIATAAGALVVLAVTAMTAAPAIMATNAPRPAIGATPGSRGLAFTNVALRTSDGVRLAGWYVPSTNRAAVVLLHGAGSTRSNVLDEAEVLARHGFGVLMLDARGHGESAGRAMDFGWFGDADIAAATTFLATRPDVDRERIGAVGLSMGGEEAIGAAATDRHLRAVVAEGVTARVADDEAWLSDAYGVRGVVQEQLERAQDLLTDVLTSASPPISLRRAVQDAPTVRFLLIAAGVDAEENETLRYLGSADPDRVHTWTVPGAGHTEGLTRSPEEWEERVISFLTQELEPG